MLEADKVARFRKVDFVLDAPRDSVALERAVERFPYVPSDPAKLRDNCYEAYNIQVQGLAQRLQVEPQPSGRSSASRAASIRPRR